MPNKSMLHSEKQKKKSIASVPVFFHSDQEKWLENDCTALALGVPINASMEGFQFAVYKLT